MPDTDAPGRSVAAMTNMSAQEFHPFVLPGSGLEVPAVAPIIVVGFAGGFIQRDAMAHGEVRFATRLRREYPLGMHVEVFENHHGKMALREILLLLDTNHDGVLAPAEKQRARVILYGHSWGGSETVALARQLERESIPVLLTVQVDSVTKRGQRDGSIPANVAEAVNFYQSNGILHGRRQIHAMDPATTRILGNFQFDYRVKHVACDRYPWFARTFMKPHIEIENDPRVWDEVDTLIRSVALGGQPLSSRNDHGLPVEIKPACCGSN